MVKGTRKQKKSSRSVSKHVLSIPQLRKAFDHMDKVVERLRKMAKHSFSDAVVSYREEWRKTFKRDLPPADAAAYLKFRYGLKAGKTRRSKTRGGAMAAPLGGAPLDYQLRAGVSGAYGNFPTYQTQGLDRYYSPAINADCGKPNGFPTDGSAASQAGGGMFDQVRSFLVNPTVPPNVLQTSIMNFKGTPPYPSSDLVGNAPLRTVPLVFTQPTFANQATRAYGADIYSTTAGPKL
jgi:hypothetical protein